MRAPHEEIVIIPRGRGYSVRRYYDPQTGQFISLDPAVDQTQAPYSYAGDDPIDSVDPSGLCNANPVTLGFWSSGNCLSDAASATADAATSLASAWEAGAGEALCYLVHDASAHAAAISAIASGLALIPGVDIVAAPVAVGFGAVAAYNDRHHPIALVLDIGGTLSGAGAFAIAVKAGGLERAASAAWRLGPIADWLRADAAALKTRALVLSVAAFGISAVATYPDH